MITKIYYEDLNLFLFDNEEKTVEWCVFHIEGIQNEDGNMCDTYDVYIFSYKDLIELAEDFNDSDFLLNLMECSTEHIYTNDDSEFFYYEKEFRHNELISGTAEELKDYLVGKIKSQKKRKEKVK